MDDVTRKSGGCETYRLMKSNVIILDRIEVV